MKLSLNVPLALLGYPEMVVLVIVLLLGLIFLVSLIGLVVWWTTRERPTKSLSAAAVDARCPACGALLGQGTRSTEGGL